MISSDLESQITFPLYTKSSITPGIKTNSLGTVNPYGMLCFAPVVGVGLTTLMEYSVFETVESEQNGKTFIRTCAHFLADPGLEGILPEWKGFHTLITAQAFLLRLTYETQRIPL